MIYLDAVGFKFLIKEIKEEINNKKIRKIQSFDNSSFSIMVNKSNLYFENKKEAIIYLRNNKLQNTDTELNFILKLKKLILGAVIVDVRQLNEDRIVCLDIEKVSITSQVVKYRLIYEFLGKSVNVVLLNEENIIETSMFTNFNSNRIMISGAKYSVPELKSVYGKYYKNLSKEKIEEFTTSYVPLIYKKNNLLTYNDFLSEEYVSYDSLNDALNSYFEENNNASQLETKRKPIIKYIKNNIKRLEGILNKIPEDIKSNSGYEKYKEIADVLASNLYKLKGGEESITLFNYYTDKDIVINLDKGLSPSKNLERLYERYNKNKRREESLKSRLKQVKEELDYFVEELMYVENEKDILGLEEIERQLGLVNNNIKSTRHSKRELKSYNIKGVEILVGRNSVENAKIVFEIARPMDIWLHAKDVAGSHVIIRDNTDDFEIIEYAAKLACDNSKLKGSGEVDYTHRKYVKRISGQGFKVNYTNYKSINIKK